MLSAARVYPVLRALEAEGLVAARRVSPGRSRGARARTYYELTPRGVEVSSVERRVLERLVRRSIPRPASRTERARMSQRMAEAEEISAAARALRDAMVRAEAR